MPSSRTCLSISRNCSPFWSSPTSDPYGTSLSTAGVRASRLSWPNVKAECRNPDSCKYRYTRRLTSSELSDIASGCGKSTWPGPEPWHQPWSASACALPCGRLCTRRPAGGRRMQAPQLAPAPQAERGPFAKGRRFAVPWRQAWQCVPRRACPRRRIGSHALRPRCDRRTPSDDANPRPQADPGPILRQALDEAGPGRHAAPSRVDERRHSGGGRARLNFWSRHGRPRVRGPPSLASVLGRLVAAGPGMRSFLASRNSVGGAHSNRGRGSRVRCRIAPPALRRSGVLRGRLRRDKHRLRHGRGGGGDCPRHAASSLGGPFGRAAHQRALQGAAGSQGRRGRGAGATVRRGGDGSGVAGGAGSGRVGGHARGRRAEGCLAGQR